MGILWDKSLFCTYAKDIEFYYVEVENVNWVYVLRLSKVASNCGASKIYKVKNYRSKALSLYTKENAVNAL